MNKITGVILANNIRAERNRANMTIDETIDKLGVSKPTYIEYEKDAKTLKVEYLIKLSEIFKCDINNFFISYNLTDS